MFTEKGPCSHQTTFGYVCAKPVGHSGKHQCDHDGLRWTWDHPGCAEGNNVPRYDSLKLTLGWLTFAGVAIAIGEVCEHLGTICRFLALFVGK